MNANLFKCLCGISDEAGSSLESQIAAHRELGWELIELRTVNGSRVVDLSRRDLMRIKSALRFNGQRVVAIDTGIGGWGRTVRTPFQHDVHELQRAIDCAHILGTRFLRIMSFANEGLAPEAWREEALERIAALVNTARVADVVLLHENCQGWASQGADHTLDMLRQINSPHLRLLFDIGNPVAYGQDGLAFIHIVGKWVQHVHIKDCSLRAGGEVEYALPGAGDANVALCLDALFRWGYQGALSIEPHLAYVPHSGRSDAAVARRRAYVSCGERLRAMLEEFASPQRNFL